MRMRSPRSAPPVNGLVGSTAMMPTVAPWSSRCSVSRRQACSSRRRAVRRCLSGTPCRRPGYMRVQKLETALVLVLDPGDGRAPATSREHPVALLQPLDRVPAGRLRLRSPLLPSLELHALTRLDSGVVVVLDVQHLAHEIRGLDHLRMCGAARQHEFDVWRPHLDQSRGRPEGHQPEVERDVQPRRG